MLFAFSRRNNCFIVSGIDAMELAERLDSICQDRRFIQFSRKYIRPGIFIIEGGTLPEAKRLAMNMNGRKHIIHPDLPLFKKGAINEK